MYSTYWKASIGNTFEWIKYSNWWKPAHKVTKSILENPLNKRYSPRLANLDDKFVFIMGSLEG